MCLKASPKLVSLNFNLGFKVKQKFVHDTFPVSVATATFASMCSSYQVWTKQPSRRERVPRAAERVSEALTPAVKCPTRTSSYLGITFMQKT